MFQKSEHANVLLRPTEDDALEADPPTDDEREDVPMPRPVQQERGGVNVVQVSLNLQKPVILNQLKEEEDSSDDEEEEENERQFNPHSDVEEFEEGEETEEPEMRAAEAKEQEEEEEEDLEGPTATSRQKRGYVSHLQYLRHLLARRKKSKVLFYL